MKPVRVCKLFGCQNRVHRFGLCNKHRKWVERGYMTENCRMLKEPNERPNYKNQVCRIPHCLKPPRRNWLCSNHSTAYRTGRISLEGERTAKRARPHSSTDRCKLCGKGGKITKDFCRTHYSQYWNGHIDLEGNVIKPPTRVHKYSEYDLCKASQCGRRPRIRGWCQTHWASFKRGNYNSQGKRTKPSMCKNKGKSCSQPDCDRPAICMGMCHMHYGRKRIGYLGPAGRKNVGQTCIEAGCGRPAAVRVMCTRHYYYWKKDQKKALAHKVPTELSEPSKNIRVRRRGENRPA